jgi:hypothetical protein
MRARRFILVCIAVGASVTFMSAGARATGDKKAEDEYVAVPAEAHGPHSDDEMGVWVVNKRTGKVKWCHIKYQGENKISCVAE